jgi:eukaryotic-like serine/threonine-protein kinase
VSAPACPRPSDLAAFVLGTLSEESLAAIARHLETCSTCEAAVAALDQLSDPVIAGLRRPPSFPGLLLAPAAPGKSASRPLPERLGDYRIVRELGRGGMGVVYEAEQVSLGRHVALKVLPRHALLDPQSIERFQRESRAAARLHHTNIVQVFGTGEQDGLHYFVMQLIRGVGLDHVVADLVRLSGGRPPGKRPTVSSRLRLGARTGTAASAPAPGAAADGHSPAATPGVLAEAASATIVPPADSGETGAGVTLDPFAHAYWTNVAGMGIQVAEALAFAHAQGIVHRDVKPSNLLLDLHGRVWITDFGLAKESAGPNDLTHSGFLVGTLRYVPPERFQGKSDARGDVYGLGLTLYELLTLRPAFSEPDRSKLLQQVMHDEPPRPRKINPAVPRDLETIVLKAIARNPAHRYQNAADLAEDLRRFVEDRPIRARRVTRVERLWRWCRRNPTTALLLAALLLVCVGGFIAVAAQWQRAENEKEETAGHLYRSRLSQARLEWRLSGSEQAEGILNQCETSRRGWEWHYLQGLSAVELFRYRHDELLMMDALDFSPDGRLLAFTGYNPYGLKTNPDSAPVEVWDLAAGRRLHTLAGPQVGRQVSFGAGGRLLAVSGAGGTAQLWDTARGEKVREWKVEGLLIFSPDGRHLASGDRKTITFWDPATGRSLRTLPSPGGRVVFSPDGRRLAVSGPEAVEVREADSGREVCRLPHGSGRQVTFYAEEGPDLAFGPDGKLLVVATQPPRVWDATTGQLVNTLGGHTGNVPGVAFSPDGCHVATACHDGSVRLWDACTGMERSTLRGHQGWVGSVRFHPKGWCLASGGRKPGDVRVWDLTRHPEHRTLPNTSAQALAFDAESGELRLVSYEGYLGVGDAATGQTAWGRRIDLSQKYVSPATVLAFSGDGRRVASVCRDRRVVKVHDARTGQVCEALVGLEIPAVSLAANRDGSRVAAAALRRPKGEEGVREVRVWDVDRAETLAVLHPAVLPDRDLRGVVALSPDGGRLAFDDYSGEQARVRVWDVGRGREVRALPLASAVVMSITFSSDGTLLAASDENERIAVWDAATGRPLHGEPLQGPFWRLVFSPDGRRLAAVDREKVKLWDVPTGQELLTLRGAPPRPLDGAFNPALTWSPDGRRLAASNWDGSTSVWEGLEGESAGTAAAWRQAESGLYFWHLREAEAGGEQSPAAAYHLEQVGAAEPPDAEALLRRARLFVRAGAWERAAVDYSRVFAAGEPEGGWDWLRNARLHLLRRDTEGYRRLCARMLAHYGADGRPPFDDSVILAAVLGPDGVADPKAAARWARESWEENSPADTLFPLALAYGRAGQWQEALARVPDMVLKHSAEGWKWWPLLALMHHHLGHAGEARLWLDKAAEKNEQLRRRAGAHWSGDAIDYRILFAEAASLLAARKP